MKVKFKYKRIDDIKLLSNVEFSLEKKGETLYSLLGELNIPSQLRNENYFEIKDKNGKSINVKNLKVNATYLLVPKDILKNLLNQKFNEYLNKKHHNTQQPQPYQEPSVYDMMDKQR